MTKAERKAFAKRAAEYHERLAEGFRRSIASAATGKAEPQA